MDRVQELRSDLAMAQDETMILRDAQWTSLPLGHGNIRIEPRPVPDAALRAAIQEIEWLVKATRQ